MKEIQAILDEEGYAVNPCPYSPFVMLGDMFCCNFCQYFAEKDAIKKVLICNNPNEEIYNDVYETISNLCDSFPDKSVARIQDDMYLKNPDYEFRKPMKFFSSTDKFNKDLLLNALKNCIVVRKKTIGNETVEYYDKNKVDAIINELIPQVNKKYNDYLDDSHSSSMCLSGY